MKFYNSRLFIETFGTYTSHTFLIRKELKCAPASKHLESKSRLCEQASCLIVRTCESVQVVV